MKSPLLGAVCARIVAGFLFCLQPAFAQDLLYTLDDPEPDFGFGDRVSQVGDVDGDNINDIAVGSPSKEANGNDGQGQVSVFSGVDGALVYVLNHPFAFRNAQFGFAIAGLGKIDSDDLSDYAVGARSSGAGARGRVFVFSGDAGSLLYTLESPSGALSLEFGSSISALGDIDGDLVTDFAVGDPSDRDTFPSDQPQGRVFIFSGLDGELIRILNNPNPVPEVAQFFGSTVSAVGDVNADHIPDVAVGAWQQRVGGLVQGQAFVFSGADGSLLYRLDRPVPQSEVAFARALAGIGDVNGDSVIDILIGDADIDVSGNERQGRAYVYSGADGALLYIVEHPIPQMNARFGTDVGAIGDVNLDSAPDFAVSGQNEDQREIYILSGVDGSLLITLNSPASQPDDFDGFGNLSQTAVGDLNGDLIPDVAIGAGRQAVGGNSAQGQVYVFSLGLAPVLVKVDIDIKPGNKQNVINPRAKGGIWVAVLSDTDLGFPFDPSAQIDIPTVEFGPDGAKAIRHKVKDINKDGLGDLLLRFKIPATGIACGDTEATLTGETFDGLSFTGTDSIKTVGCKKSKKSKK